MSSMPECIKCGEYIHSGFVVCENCNDELPTIRAELSALRAENARLRAECEAAENFVNYLQEFLAFDAAWGDSEGHHWIKYQQARAARLTVKE